MTAGLKAGWKPGRNKQLDGELEIKVGGTPLKFLLEIKQELRNHNLPKVLEQAASWKNLMVVADRILPGIKEELRRKHIAYLEGNGNIFIDRKPVFIWLDNNKPLEVRRERPNRAFGKTGLQVVFLFLADKTYINKPYRVIAQAADTALGNVNYVMNGLQELGFLLRKDKDEFILNNQKVLLDKWVTLYNEKLKPALHTGNFRFMGNPAQDWSDFSLNVDETVWGGEPGGDILTNYLRPAILTLYTNEPRKNLMQQFRIAPDESGEVKVYRKFWTLDTILTPKEAAPPLIVYADLMGTNDKRCIETARMIYERYIEPNL